MYKVKHDRDHGLRAFMRQFGKKIKVKVGIQGREMYEPLRSDSPFSMVDLGLVHEFGSVEADVPQRSFMRSTADENKNKYMGRLKKIARKIVKKPDSVNVKSEIFLLGENVRRNVIQKINSNIPPPLAESTVENKSIGGEGDDTLALVNYGLMIGAITSVIDDE